MLTAVKRFNKTAKKVQSIMHLASRTYYKNGLTRISSREFKILNVPDNIDKKEIEPAIRKLLKGRHPFFIKDKRSPKGDIIFTLKNEHA